MNIFTADHHGFYLNGSPFCPLVQDMALIRLPAYLSDDLDWSHERQEAEQAVLEGKYIFWEVDLALASFQFSPEDSASFYSFSLALEEFSKKLWPSFQNHTFGVAVYRGGMQLHHNFPTSLWETDGPDHELHLVQLLSEYLHRLISFLPEAALPFAFIDVTGISSPARQAQLFSKDRFEYLNLALEGAKVPFSGICWEGRPGGPPATSVGVCLPDDAHIDAATLQKMDTLIADLMGKGLPFRIVPEEKLTEQWDGLDKLIVFPSALSAQGKRKLLGFTAAGGDVLTSEEFFDGAQIFE